MNSIGKLPNQGMQPTGKERAPAEGWPLQDKFATTDSKT